MLNRPENYSEAGRKAAEARNQRDEARALHWSRHYRLMRAAEPEQADKMEAMRLFDTAYKDHRTTTP